MRRIAIAGAGVEGASNYRYFSQLPNTEITILDQKSLDESMFPLAKYVSGPDYLDNLDAYDLVVHSPGIRPDKLAVDSSKVTTNTKEFFAHCPAPIIGVTGTKGKGTTSTLIAKFLKADGKTVHLLGNIGTPALDELPKIKATDWVVYELSSYQLFDLDKSPHIAVHLMFAPDHLDIHTDLSEYAAAKANIFRFQKVHDVAVYYVGSAQATRSAELSPAKTKLPFDRTGKFPDGCYVKENVVWLGKTPVIDVVDIALVGEHMLDNVCAAVTATFHLISDRTVYARVLSHFTGLPHRLQVVAYKNGVRYIDDSISTIPSTAIAAIQAFSEPKILILGGSDKGSNFDELAQVVSQSDVKHVFVMGIMADKIAQSLQKANYTYFTRCNNLEQVMNSVALVVQAGDVVLLSPACASFDMFDSYVQRGELFSRLANDIKTQ